MVGVLLYGWRSIAMVLPPGMQSRRPNVATVRRTRESPLRAADAQQSPWRAHLGAPHQNGGRISGSITDVLGPLRWRDGAPACLHLHRGFCPPLQVDVELQSSVSLEDAMSLARSFERRLITDDATVAGCVRRPCRPQLAP